MITTTLGSIRAAEPCKEGWAVLLKALGKTEADDEPLPLARILEANGLDDALWVLQFALPDDRLARHYHAWAAERVLPLFEARYPGDGRIRAQIAMLRNDEATAAQRDKARVAAVDAWQTAAPARRKVGWRDGMCDATSAAEAAATEDVWLAAWHAVQASWIASVEKAARDCLMTPRYAWADVLDVPDRVRLAAKTASKSAELQAQAAHFLEVVSQETATAQGAGDA